MLKIKHADNLYDISDCFVRNCGNAGEMAFNEIKKT